MNIEDFVHKLNELFCSQTISIYSNANDTIMISVKYEDNSLAITLPCNLKNIVNDKAKEDSKLTSSQKDLIRSIQTIDDYRVHENESMLLYKQLYKNLNESSLSMISLPADAMNNPCAKKSFVTWMNGDANLKGERMQNIENHFSCLKGLNADFQIPHHGSGNNLSRMPQKLKEIRAYIWAGSKNQYGHPSGSILKIVMQSGCQCNWLMDLNVNPIIRQEYWI